METVLRIPKNPDGTAKTIPPISPSLMPFHIVYSGPAPISTYFMPRKFVDEREELRRGLIENSASVGSGSTSKQDAAGAAPLGDTRDEVESKYFQESGKEGEVVGPVVPTPPAPATGVESGKQKEEEERLSASFRGRRIVSQNVRIPEGFVGVLLTHDGTTTASTSSSSNVRAPIVDDTVNEDVPVNEGQDEYIRSLNEWISLNAEIHKI
ncbi:hypothetical protein FS842_004475 [Serendipita sp. 407]|nr:hypothetical protein FS842_004475 [Serendipita sp. 407]